MIDVSSWGWSCADESQVMTQVCQRSADITYGHTAKIPIPHFSIFVPSNGCEDPPPTLSRTRRAEWGDEVVEVVEVVDALPRLRLLRCLAPSCVGGA